MKCTLIIVLFTELLQLLARSAEVVIPSDRRFKEQTQHYITGYQAPDRLGPLRTPEAWAITSGFRNVRVAVVSSGIDHSLEELKGRLITGFNFVSLDTNTMDVQPGGGTCLATILGANANNPHPLDPSWAFGIAGFDWNCEIMPVKVYHNGNLATKESMQAQGIVFAADNGATIILVGKTSGLGSDNLARTEVSQAISNAVARGSIVISAAGDNSGAIYQSAPLEPRSMTVGSVSIRTPFYRSSFSNKGPTIDFMAPGEDILCCSTGQGNSMGTFMSKSSTEVSAAMVAGICSLMAAVRPAMTPEEAYLLLAAGADDRGGVLDPPGWDETYGWGQVNAYNSVLLANFRIDSVKISETGQAELSWPSPPNASIRNYYEVQFSSVAGSAWRPVVGAFSYTPERTTWKGPFATGFYRVRVTVPGIN